MLPFRRILFPVDYSEPCKAMVPYVKDMLSRFPAELTLVHAYGAEALAYSELPIGDPELAGEAQAVQQQRLHEFAAGMFPGWHAECFAVCGEPGSVVHDVLEQQSADLVMMPTHGRGPVRRFLLGSVTAKVLHDVSAAVWTGAAPAITGHSPHLPYKSILCSVDGTPESECVLRAAGTLSCIYGASLNLVHVVDPMPANEFDMSAYQQDRIEAAHISVRELKAAVGVDAQHNVIESPVADGVQQEALRVKADLVIAGRGHAQGAFTALRSHLYQIIRESPCPVLSV